MVLVRVLLLYILCVRDSRLGEIGGLPEFSGYLVPHLRGGTRAAVSCACGGNIVIQYWGIISVGYEKGVNSRRRGRPVIYCELGNT